ncbi:MAG: NAD(P)/FAD-dependent oxidoreductase [Bacteroidales bacterium]|nr:NAD(P)/FAD-dependent oxidoreductase [Bacteroidales bacterium]
MNDKRVIVIGAGLGGLMTGALLAKEGCHVTVVEKNPKVGGCLQSYTRFGTTFDTGMHLFGGMAQGGNIRRICDYLGIAEQFTTLDLDCENDVEIFVGADNRLHPVNLSRDYLVESLSRYFPGYQAELQGYISAINRIVDGMDLFHLRPAESSLSRYDEEFLIPADHFLAKYISEPRLRAILAIINTLYAGEKGISPTFLHAVLATIFLNGACRVTGGYSHFAKALNDCILANGGKIITGDGASSIFHVDNSLVINTVKGNKYTANYVVSAISPESTLAMVDSREAFSDAYRQAIEDKSSSLSAFIVNIKLKPYMLPFSNRIGFYIETYDDAWSTNDGDEVDKFFYMTPPTLHQGAYAETLNVVLPMRWSRVERWDNTSVGNRGEDYENFKQQVYNQVVAKLRKIMPNVEDAIDKVDLATPLTIREYTGVKEGAMCGARKECNDPLIFLPVATRMPGLFLTGQSVNMHGFCGVSLTAIQTAEAILGKNAIINHLQPKS